ncbi:MAG: metallophosphoesterase family protein [Thermodesulfovibrionaceae bacterium]
MKLGILGDIHGNIEALKVAHQICLDEKVDKVYHTGDLGGYAPFVNEVVDFLVEHKIEGVQGNYDEAVAYDRPHCGCKYENDHQAAMAYISFKWTKKNVSKRAKNYMKSLPFSISFQVEGKKVKIFHATPLKNNLYWYEERDTKFYLLMAEKANAQIMIYGHTHIPYFRRIDDYYFINAGSVGQPKDGDPRTCLCVIEIDKDVKVQFIRKEYNIQKVAKAIIQKGLPEFFAEKLILAK